MEILKLIRGLPATDEGRILGRQLLRSATSVGANYRATCRARSKAEFVAKMGIVVEEADETVYWLELLEGAGLLGKGGWAVVISEAQQLLAIFAASLRTARANRSMGQ